MDNFIPTNTFSSASFDILTLDGIEDPLININKLSTLDFEESYFAKATTFIIETSNEYTINKKALYKAIAESQNTTIVLESFSDFFVKTKQIIDKFLKFIKNLFQKFLTTINKMIESEEYLKCHKKDLENFKYENNFKFEGFNYTFSEDIPLSDAVLEFNNFLFADLYGNQSSNLTSAGISDSINNIDLENDYAIFRAKVIGKDGKIFINNFSDELFAIYRNNSNNTEYIEVDNAYIKMVTDRFFNYKKIKGDINFSYKKVEDSYKKVQSQVESIVNRNGDLNAQAFLNRLPDQNNITQIDGRDLNISGFTMSNKFMTQLDIYIKMKVDQIQEYSNIHALAFAAKLDALKECKMQDKSTLYTALHSIYKSNSL